MNTNSAPRITTTSPRMGLANVVRGRQERPVRVVLYGVEGVGKSTFAADAPAPIFLCAEDGTAHLDVTRFPTPRTWHEALDALTILAREEHSYKTLAIDSLDWLEPICWAHVCQVHGKRNIEDFGYGKGYVHALDEWRQLLARLDVLTRTGMNVVLLAHSAVRRKDNPDSDAFDRYVIKMHDKAAALLMEWADAVLFAQHELRVIHDRQRNKSKGQSSGARVMRTTWTAAYDAKNRFGLPETLPLSWDELEEARRAARDADPKVLRAEVVALVPQLPEGERARALKVLEEWAGNNPVRLRQLADRCRAKLQGADASTVSEAS